MKNFLRTLKLIDYLESEIEIDQSEFLLKLRENVDEGDTGFLSDFFDIFSSSKNEFKGSVYSEGFKIKRRRRLFDMSMNLSTAEGKLIQEGTLLRINTEINGFSGMMIPFYIFITIIYSIFIFGFTIVAFAGDNSQIGFALPFIIIHGAFMYGAPYLMMRRSTKRMKHELERELFYLTKK